MTKSFWKQQGQHLPFVCLGLVLLLMASATFVEYIYGKAIAHNFIYDTPLFHLLLALLALSAIPLAFIFPRRSGKRYLHLGFYTAFVVILAGAYCTHCHRKEAQLSLREGQSTALLLTAENKVLHLPFAVQLERFEQVNYWHTPTPADYRSHLLIAGQRYVVSMNQTLSYEGYRFFQQSYDKDRKGSSLLVVHDPWGVAITYTGYALLFMTIAAGLLSSLVATLRKTRRSLRSTWLFALFFTLALPAAALPITPRSFADEQRSQPIVYNGRVMPLNTLARDFSQKLQQNKTFPQLTPEQFLLSLQNHPKAWEKVPLFHIDQVDLRQHLGIKNEQVALADLYDATQQRLHPKLLQNIADKHEAQQALRQLQEQVALLLALQDKRLYRPLPHTETAALQTRLAVELFYNRLPNVLFCFIALFCIGAFCLLVQVFKKSWHFTSILALCGNILSLCYLLLLFGLRWYLGEYIPLSNGFETMLFLAIVVQVLALLFRSRTPLSLIYGLLLAACFLLTAYLSIRSPSITHLQPVLNSPLLCLHVAICMFSYGLLSFITFNSACVLLRLLWHLPSLSSVEVTTYKTLRSIVSLSLWTRQLLPWAVHLLWVGIFIGGIWANQSWGNYWSWDPKEVWALITVLLYSFGLYPQHLPFVRRTASFHLFLLLAFLSVIFTFVGVNYFLGGMHSYA